MKMQCYVKQIWVRELILYLNFGGVGQVSAIMSGWGQIIYSFRIIASLGHAGFALNIALPETCFMVNPHLVQFYWRNFGIWLICEIMHHQEWRVICWVEDLVEVLACEWSVAVCHIKGLQLPIDSIQFNLPSWFGKKCTDFNEKIRLVIDQVYGSDAIFRLGVSIVGGYYARLFHLGVRQWVK